MRGKNPSPWTFDDPACVIVKHANPCGVAESEDISSAYDLAFQTDPTSAFGGIIALNRTLDTKTAQEINTRQFVEVILATDYEEGALAEFAKKKNVRVLRVDLEQDNPYPVMIKKVSGGILIQSDDTYAVPREDLKCVTKRQPTPDELNDLMFAWRVAKFVKSNAIVYVKNRQTIGIGAGQMSRVISADIANLKAKQEGLEVTGAVMASDAFFPFRDGIDKAASSGIASIIQPGGSIRDDEVIGSHMSRKREKASLMRRVRSETCQGLPQAGHCHTPAHPASRHQDAHKKLLLHRGWQDANGKPPSGGRSYPDRQSTPPTALRFQTREKHRR